MSHRNNAVQNPNKGALNMSAGGSNDKDEFASFLHLLVELIQLERGFRASELDIKTLQREHGEQLAELDSARMALWWLEEGLQMADDDNNEEHCCRDINRLDEQLKQKGRRIQDLKNASNQQQSKIRVLFDRLFSFKDKSEDRPIAKYLRLSPLFWERLRKLEATAELLQRDQHSLSQAQDWEQSAKDAIHAAIPYVNRAIERVESGLRGSRHELEQSMALLQRAMNMCRWHMADLVSWEDFVAIRSRQQRTNQSMLLIETATPILEAAKLIRPDRLRISQIDQEQPGEPLFYLANAGDQLTKAQKNEFFWEFRDANRLSAKCETVLHDLDNRQDEYMTEYFDNDPNYTRDDFDREFLWYKSQAMKQLIDAEKNEERLRVAAMEAGALNEKYAAHDFEWKPDDDKHWTPRTKDQLKAKANRFPAGRQKGGRWRHTILFAEDTHLYEDPEEAQQPPSVGDGWLLRPVEFQDQDRYSELSLDRHEDVVLRQKLLRRYQADCRDLRNHFAAHSEKTSDSDVETTWCC